MFHVFVSRVIARVFSFPPLQAWALIRASTGIADPDLFIQKHLNCDHLETQLMELKQARVLPYNHSVLTPRSRQCVTPKVCTYGIAEVNANGQTTAVLEAYRGPKTVA